MDYARIYADFIASRRQREQSLASFETHHIVPRAVGGTNDAENLIRLSPQDHLFAHLILTRFYDHKAVFYAAHMMLNRTGKLKGKAARARFALIIDRCRLEKSKWQAERMACPKLRERTSNALSGVPKDPDAIRRRSLKRIGKLHSDEARAAMSAAHTGVKLSDNHRRELIRALRGRAKSEASKAKLSAALKGRPRDEATRATLRDAAIRARQMTPEDRAHRLEVVRAMSSEDKSQVEIAAALGISKTLAGNLRRSIR